MKSFVKNAVALLVAVLICSGITLASSLGMFAKIEKNFYEPAVLKSIRDHLDAVAEAGNEYILQILEQLGAEKNGFLSHDSVLTYFNNEPSKEVGRRFSRLLEDVPALDGMRIVENGGKSVQFSSYKDDSRFLKGVRTYSNYNELTTYRGRPEIPYPLVSAFSDDAAERNSCRIVFDGDEQRIIISYPLYNNERAYSVIFYINPIDFVNLLLERRVISVNEQLTLVSSEDGSEGGFVFGMPRVGRNSLAAEIVRRWHLHSYGPDEIASSAKVSISGVSAGENASAETGAHDEYISLNLISSARAQKINVGGIYSADMLLMPLYIRILLLICAFITVSLIVVILFNVRKDDDVEILAKIKKVQIGLLNEYFEKNVDRTKVAALIEVQKDALTAKIKKSLGLRGKKYGDDLSIILNQSWNDIINILSGSNNLNLQGLSADDMTEIRRMFEEAVATSNLRVQAVTQFPSRQNPKVKKILENAAHQASHEEQPQVSRETQEKINAVFAAAQSGSPVVGEDALADGDVADAVPLEDVGGVEPVEEIGEVEDEEKILDAEPVEELSEVADAEELLDAEPIEELTDAEQIDEIEPLEEVAEDAEAVDEVLPVSDEEFLGDAEPVDDAETLDDVELTSTADDADDVEAVALDDVENTSPEAEPMDAVVPLPTVSQIVAATEDSSSIKSSDMQNSASEHLTDGNSDGTIIEEMYGFGIDTTEERRESPIPDDFFEEFLQTEKEVLSKDTERIRLDSHVNDKKILDESKLVSVDTFIDDSVPLIVTTPRNDISQFEGTEPLVIGDPAPLYEKAPRPENNDVSDNFVVYPLDSLFEIQNENDNPSSLPADNGNILGISLPNAPEENDDIEELEEISGSEEDFMFTTFAANDKTVSDLAPDAIVQNEDGVFSIAGDLVVSGVKVDDDFKRLVDSVLKN